MCCLSVFPTLTLLLNFPIKLPHQSSKHDPHLQIRKIPPQTIPWSNIEWLNYFPVVVFKFFIAQPTFGDEFIRSSEVGAGMESSPVVDDYGCFARDEIACDGTSFRRCDSCCVSWGWRVDA